MTRLVNQKNGFLVVVGVLVLFLAESVVHGFLQQSSAVHRTSSSVAPGRVADSSLSVLPELPLPSLDHNVISNDLNLLESPQRVLYDIAHVALDFSTLIRSGRLASVLLRSFPVLGRVCVIGADYIPDQSINAEELLIQIFMMGVALKDFASAIKQQDTTTQQSV